MDQFHVPKYINRVVYNAVAELQCLQPGFVSAELISETVKNQLRRTKYSKLTNLDEAINKSLRNMAHMGVLSQTGFPEYAIHHNLKYTKPRTNRLNMWPSRTKSNKVKSTQRVPISRKRQSKSNTKQSSMGIMCKECHSTCSDLLKQYKSIQLVNFKEANETGAPTETMETNTNAPKSIYS